jgi:hypothetical protein
VGLSNLAAYLLWPRDFPQTIPQSIHGLSRVGASFGALSDLRDPSFSRALLLIPDVVKAAQTGGKIPDDFLAGPRSVIGYGVLVLVIVAVLALGRRIPPVMVGIVLLACAIFSTPFISYYYLALFLPVAALVVRDPDGPPGAGRFDRFAIHGGRRRAVGRWVSFAAALSIAQVAVPFLMARIPIVVHQGTIGTATVVTTTEFLAPILWLVTCAVIIVSYARRPAPSHDDDQGPVREGPPDAAGDTSSRTSELMTDSSPRGPA